MYRHELNLFSDTNESEIRAHRLTDASHCLHNKFQIGLPLFKKKRQKIIGSSREKLKFGSREVQLLANFSR